MSVHISAASKLAEAACVYNDYRLNMLSTSRKTTMASSPHPIQVLHSLSKNNAQADASGRVKKSLDSIPPLLREKLCKALYELSTEKGKGGERYGEFLALRDSATTIRSIEKVSKSILDSLHKPEQDVVFGHLYQIAGCPQTSDGNWGEHHATDNYAWLIQALHECGHLDKKVKSTQVYHGFENSSNPSRRYTLGRLVLDGKGIGFVNGTNCDFEAAKYDARRISDWTHCKLDIDGTYRARARDFDLDYVAAFASMQSTSLPSVPLIVQTWNQFFAREDASKVVRSEPAKYVQCSASGGSIEVDNALRFLDQDLCDRLIIINIAGACYTHPDKAGRVFNLAISEDEVSKIAKNQGFITEGFVTFLPMHSDSKDPHDTHGSSYRGKVGTLLNSYLRTGDCDYSQ